MFFRGIDSKLMRAAYLAVTLSFVTAPIHFLVGHKGDRIFLITNTIMSAICLLAVLFGKPRDNSQSMALGIYALIAWVVHLMML